MDHRQCSSLAFSVCLIVYHTRNAVQLAHNVPCIGRYLISVAVSVQVRMQVLDIRHHIQRIYNAGGNIRAGLIEREALRINNIIGKNIRCHTEDILQFNIGKGIRKDQVNDVQQAVWIAFLHLLHQKTDHLTLALRTAVVPDRIAGNIDLTDPAECHRLNAVQMLIAAVRQLRRTDPCLLHRR